MLAFIDRERERINTVLEFSLKLGDTAKRNDAAALSVEAVLRKRVLEAANTSYTGFSPTAYTLFGAEKDKIDTYLQTTQSALTGKPRLLAVLHKKIWGVGKAFGGPLTALKLGAFLDRYLASADCPRNVADSKIDNKQVYSAVMSHFDLKELTTVASVFIRAKTQAIDFPDFTLANTGAGATLTTGIPDTRVDESMKKRPKSELDNSIIAGPVILEKGGVLVSAHSTIIPDTRVDESMTKRSKSESDNSIIAGPVILENGGVLVSAHSTIIDPTADNGSLYIFGKTTKKDIKDYLRTYDNLVDTNWGQIKADVFKKFKSSRDAMNDVEWDNLKEILQKYIRSKLSKRQKEEEKKAEKRKETDPGNELDGQEFSKKTLLSSGLTGALAPASAALPAYNKESITQAVVRQAFVIRFASRKEASFPSRLLAYTEEIMKLKASDRDENLCIQALKDIGMCIAASKDTALPLEDGRDVRNALYVVFYFLFSKTDYPSTAQERTDAFAYVDDWPAFIREALQEGIAADAPRY